ncbi:MAG: hypothetical protein JXJ17_11350 [Anaerolineae bacterium]|nr:hypothetical protein [Anaerolineae bacterium]
MNQLPAGITLLIVLSALLAGCANDPLPVTQEPMEVSATSVPVSPASPATPFPTEVSRQYKLYSHPSGVFSLSIPVDWQVLDTSSDLRLLTSCIPPVGYGSRVTVDVTNEGPLPPENVRALAESYVHLHYLGTGNYSEISRTELPDGRLQFVFQFDDEFGAKGRETLYIQQEGPYFTALGVFLAEKDAYTLSNALDAITASFSVDPLTAWGGKVAEINSDSLKLANTALWQDEEGIFYYMGEVRNDTTFHIAEIKVRAALCDQSGIIVADVSKSAALDWVEAGGSTPFSIKIEDVPDEVSVCGAQASAIPADYDTGYTTGLSIEPEASYNDDNQIRIEGSVTNPGLAAVTEVEVFLIIYDPDDRVIGFTRIKLGEDVELGPGQSTRFDYTFKTVGGQPDRFATLAQAKVISTLDPSLAPDNN